MAKTPKNPSINISLDRERKLTLDLNALVTLGELTGKNMFAKDAFSELYSAMSPLTLRAWLFSLLLADDTAGYTKEPTLTLQSVGAMIHSGNMGYVMNKLMEAANAGNVEGDSKKPAPLAEGEESK